jgi:hypothetical protein
MIDFCSKTMIKFMTLESMVNNKDNVIGYASLRPIELELTYHYSDKFSLDVNNNQLSILYTKITDKFINIHN